MLPDWLRQISQPIRGARPPTMSGGRPWEANFGLSRTWPPTFGICLSQSESTASHGLPRPPTRPPMTSHMASQFGLPQPPNSASHSLTQPRTASHGLPIRPHTASQFCLSHGLSHGLSLGLREHGLTDTHGPPLPPTQPPTCPPNLASQFGLPIRTPTASHMASHGKLEKLVIFSEFLGGRGRPWEAVLPDWLRQISQPIRGARPPTMSSGRLWEAEFGLSRTQPPTFSHVICLSQSEIAQPVTASHSLPIWPPMASQFSLPHGLPRPLTASQFGLSHGLSHSLPIWHLTASQFGLSHGRSLSLSHGLREHGLPWPPTQPRKCPPNSDSHMASHCLPHGLQCGLPMQPPTQPLTQPQGAWPPTASHTAFQFGLPWPTTWPHMALHGLPHGLPSVWEAVGGHGRPNLDSLTHSLPHFVMSSV